jgi:protein-S-isoprenylcysteine O-methyltransferase Ste14
MTAPRPKSIVNQSEVLLSILAIGAVVAAVKLTPLEDRTTCFLLLIFASAAPYVVRAAIRPNAARARGGSKQTSVFARLVTKMVGLCAIYAAIALVYFTFPSFSGKLTLPLLNLIREFWIVLVIVAPLYVWLTDRSMNEPEDGLFYVGRLVVAPRRPIKWDLVKQYLLGWAVKGFFLPIMIGFAYDDIDWLLSMNFSEELRKSRAYYDVVYRGLYFVDVIYASAGYLFTMKLISAEIRSTDSTVGGWFVCLICYPPFWDFVSDNFLNYGGNYYWDQWIGWSDLLWFVWGTVILALVVIYVWGTASLGIRFSNLTNRGIVTAGPYRWVKHPCYVAKNISWWLISIPFVAGDTTSQCVRGCLALSMLNLIYYFRAKTEERHLLKDPAYAEYAAWIRSNGLMAILSSRVRLLAPSFAPDAEQVRE